MQPSGTYKAKTYPTHVSLKDDESQWSEHIPALQQTRTVPSVGSAAAAAMTEEIKKLTLKQQVSEYNPAPDQVSVTHLILKWLCEKYLLSEFVS